MKFMVAVAALNTSYAFPTAALRVGFLQALTHKSQSALNTRYGFRTAALGVGFLKALTHKSQSATWAPARRIPGIRAMAKSAVDVSKDGEFERAPSSFRSVVSREPGARFTPEADRYHLYISYTCPWASRTYLVLKLKGLEDTIGLTVTKSKFEKTREDPADEHEGWAFAGVGEEEPGAQLDTLNGASFVRDLYDKADSSYTGRFTVPVFWDKKLATIVNNESSDIIKFLNDEFNDFAKRPEVDLYPSHLKTQIEAVNSWTYDGINNGVYRAGFATKQKAFDEAVTDVFNGLDKAEEILSKQRYIAGDVITEADIRLFVTLIRFDEAYMVNFKCNKRALREYPNLFNYTKDVYQLPGAAETVNMAHIRNGYYRSMPSINKFGIIPPGPQIDYSSPHDRARFSH